MTEVGPELDAARLRVVEDGLMPDAIRELTPVVSALPLEALGPVKQSLKRFFSDAAWTAEDDDAAGRHRRHRERAATPASSSPASRSHGRGSEGRFRLRVDSDVPDARDRVRGRRRRASDATDLGETFDGAVVPEATPSPRTIRFATPPLEARPSAQLRVGHRRLHRSTRARLFDDFDEITQRARRTRLRGRDDRAPRPLGAAPRADPA